MDLPVPVKRRTCRAASFATSVFSPGSRRICPSNSRSESYGEAPGIATDRPKVFSGLSREKSSGKAAGSAGRKPSLPLSLKS